MSYMKLNNARIHENGKRRSLFDKVHEIKDYIKTAIPEIDESKILTLMSHCRRFHEGNLVYGRIGSKKARKIPLSANERIVYSFLIQQKLNPSTVYRWFLASRIPADIRSQLASGRISQKRAFKLSANRLRNRMSREGMLLIESIRDIVSRY